MKKNILKMLLLNVSAFATISYPDFTISMMRNGNGLNKYNEIFRNNNEDVKNIKNLEIFRSIYANSILNAAEEKIKQYRIPRIVHQIWLGSPVPIRYYAWMSSWMNWHGWEYKLWTDKDVKDFLLYNQELYDKAANYGEKSDILRLEILLHYGGIYADVDFECVNPTVFEELNQSYDFYVGFEPLEHGLINGIYKTCNALMASIPHHPLLKNLVVNMKSNWEKYANMTAVEKSGPDYLSRSFMAYENYHLDPENKAQNNELRNIYLPCSFLYPFSEPEIRGAKSREDLLSRIFPETGAIHYWSGSWFLPGGR